MSKVAIITITNSGTNFGNRLQNYALQTVLESYSLDVETIYSSKSIYNSILISKIRRVLKLIFKTSKRSNCFNKFDKNNIKKSKEVRYEFLNEHIFADKYDAFIAGSDQVWNPTFPFNSSFEFMTFAPSNKRFSYAASFGISEIPKEDTENFKTRINELQSISVREDQGAKIVENLTGKIADVHIDPSMLLSAESYIEIEKAPELSLPNEYILIYFLGEISQDYREFIDNLSQKLSVPIVELSELANSALYNIGPEHFLYLFRHAKYICTDSFHGAIFSILFHNQVTVFYRRDKDQPMDSRIETLLDKMSLQDRLFGKLNIDESLKSVDYEKVELCLEKERKQSYKYLEKIINQWKK